MHRLTVTMLTLAAVLATGCQTRGDVRPFSSEVPLPPTFASVTEQCNGAEARFALGQVVTQPLLEEARNRTGARQAITAKTGEIPAPPNPLRLIVEVDAQGKMVGARCG